MSKHVERQKKLVEDAFAPDAVRGRDARRAPDQERHRDASRSQSPATPRVGGRGDARHWHKRVGEAVKRDENLIDVETDKVVLELPAPATGVLVEIRKGDGATVVGQEVVAVIDTSRGRDGGAPRRRRSRRQRRGPRPRRRAGATAARRSLQRPRCPRRAR